VLSNVRRMTPQYCFKFDFTAIAPTPSLGHVHVAGVPRGSLHQGRAVHAAGIAVPGTAHGAAALQYKFESKVQGIDFCCHTVVCQTCGLRISITTRARESLSRGQVLSLALELA